MMNDQYVSFFNNVRKFVLDTGLAIEGNIIGASLEEIWELERKYSLNVPEFLKIYLSVFGKKCEISNTDSNLKITLDKIEEAVQYVHEKKIHFRFENERFFKIYGVAESMADIRSMVNLSSVFFFKKEDKILSFFDGDDENPKIHYFMENRSLCFNEVNFISFIRARLLLAISSKIWAWGKNYPEDLSLLSTFDRKSYEKQRKINLDMHPWARLYTCAYKSIVMPENVFQDLRSKFYKFNEEYELQNNLIRSIDEFEWAFVDYLKQNGYELYNIEP